VSRTAVARTAMARTAVAPVSVASKSSVGSTRRPADYDKRAHVCTVCNRRFGRPSLLKRHLVIHTGKCPSLSYSFCVIFGKKVTSSDLVS